MTFSFKIVSLQIKALPAGLDNIILVDDEVRRKTYAVGSQGGGGVDTSGKKWKTGELEFEALMRQLDNAVRNKENLRNYTINEWLESVLLPKIIHTWNSLLHMARRGNLFCSLLSMARRNIYFKTKNFQYRLEHLKNDIDLLFLFFCL